MGCPHFRGSRSGFDVYILHLPEPLEALGAQTTAFDIGIAIITFLGFAYGCWFFYSGNE
jgi:hypothetical protein